MKKDCPKNSGNSVNNDIENLVIGMIEVDNIEFNNAQFPVRHVGMLGDSGAQGNTSVQMIMEFSRFQMCPLQRCVRKITVLS